MGLYTESAHPYTINYLFYGKERSTSFRVILSTHNFDFVSTRKNKLLEDTELQIDYFDYFGRYHPTQGPFTFGSIMNDRTKIFTQKQAVVFFAVKVSTLQQDYSAYDVVGPFNANGTPFSSLSGASGNYVENYAS